MKNGSPTPVRPRRSPYRAAEERPDLAPLPAHPVFRAYDMRTGAYVGVVARAASAHEAKPYAAELYGVPFEAVGIVNGRRR